MRALVAGQPDTDPVAITAGDAAEVLLEVRRVLQGVVRGGRQSLPLEIGAPLHLQDRGADEQLDADEGRDGVAGQSDEWPAFDRSHHERLSRPKCDLPEVDGPLLFQERADQVVGAHRDATRADDQVGSDRCLEPGDEVFPDVARHPGIDDLRTRLLECRAQRIAVGVRDLPGPERLPGVSQLIAGCQHRDARTPNGSDRGAPGRCQDADQPRADDAAPLGNRVAAADIAAGMTDAGVGFDANADFDPSVALNRVLDAHDRVRTLRHDSARHDPQGGGGAHRHGGRDAGPDLAEYLQVDRFRSRCGARVRRPHGIAVHGGIRERWDVAVRGHVLGEHAPTCFHQWRVLRVEDADPGEDPVARLGDRQKGRLLGLTDRSSDCFRTRARRPRRQ